MKGLIIKDLYCLKKEMKLFLGVTIGSAIVSVLFLLSARYGNIANALADIQKTEMISGEELLRLTDMLALLVIYLPIALTGCVVECFKEDSKAGFGNIMFSMPVSYKKIVGIIKRCLYSIMKMRQLCLEIRSPKLLNRVTSFYSLVH